MRVCSVPGCEKAHVARGLCVMHLRRLTRHGSLDKLTGVREELRIPHGGGKAGRDGCSCDLCRAAYAAYFRRMRQRADVVPAKPRIWEMYDCTPTRDELLEMRS